MGINTAERGCINTETDDVVGRESTEGGELRRGGEGRSVSGGVDREKVVEKRRMEVAYKCKRACRALSASVEVSSELFRPMKKGRRRKSELEGLKRPKKTRQDETRLKIRRLTSGAQRPSTLIQILFLVLIR